MQDAMTTVEVVGLKATEHLEKLIVLYKNNHDPLLHSHIRQIVRGRDLEVRFPQSTNVANPA